MLSRVSHIGDCLAGARRHAVRCAWCALVCGAGIRDTCDSVTAGVRHAGAGVSGSGVLPVRAVGSTGLCGTGVYAMQACGAR